MRLDRALVVNLLLALAALGTFGVVLATRDAPTTDELAERAGNLFPAYSRARLTRVESRGGPGAFVLAYEPAADGGEASARLLAPPAAAGAADPEAAEALARALETAAFLRRFDAEAADRAALGLDGPGLELHVTGRGFDATLRVGKKAATPAGATYVEVRGGGADDVSVGLVRDELVRQLVVPADELRPRALSSFATSDLAALSFEDGDVRVALKRGRGPAWLGADGARVARDAVERLVLELSRVKADGFLDPKRAPAPTSGLAARFLPSRGAALEFRIGDACPGSPDRLLLVRSSPTPAAFCVTPATRGLFREIAGALADDAPFALHTDEVEALAIEGPDGKLELRRDERGFRLLAPSAADVELEAGNQRLQALIGARGERIDFPAPPALGLMPPIATVRLTSSVIEGTPRFEEILDVGRARPDGRLPVRRREDGVVLLLSRDAARATAVDTTFLRSRELSSFGPSDVQELAVDLPGERQRLRRTASGLELVEPRGATHDTSLVLDAIQALGTLHAERWVADRDDGGFGIDAPRVVARAELRAGDAGARSVTLRIGAKTAGGAYAALDGDPGVFVVSGDVEAALSTLLLSRDVFGSDPEAIAELTLEAKGRRLRLERRGDELRGKDATDLLPADVERLVQSVATLRPIAAVHTGPARPAEGFVDPSLVVRVVLAEGPARRTKTIRVGAGDSFRDSRVFYARVDGVDATYALSQRDARQLIDGF